MIDVQQITKSLGGRPVLGKSITSGGELVDLIHLGLPASAAAFVLSQGLLSKQEFNWLVAPERTYMRRLKEKKLSAEESDKLTRFIRVRNFAAEILGSEDDADAWLRESNSMLHDQRPIEFLDTDSGSQIVETLLGRIAHGILS